MKQTKNRKNRPDWTGRGPGLFGHLYLALAVQGALLAVAVYGGGAGRAPMLYGAIGLLATAALLAAAMREALQDWLALLSPAGRFAFFLVFAGCFIVPVAWRGARGLPEAFVWTAIPLTFLAVTEPLVRRLIALQMLGFWFALMPSARPDLAIVLAFSAASLWSLACAHYAFMGAPFGLRGWWPVSRIAQAVVIYGVPAALVASLAWRVWPSGPGWADAAPGAAAPVVGVRVAPRSLATFDAEEFKQAMIRLALAGLALLVSMVAVHYGRRLLRRRARPVSLPAVRGADVGQVSVVESRRLPPRPSLKGLRDKIVRQWGRWAREAGAIGPPRGRGETAAEWAARLAVEPEATAPPDQLTELMESAHYGPAEPTEADLERTRRLVAEAIKRAE